MPVSSVESYKKKDNSALILYPNPTNHSITIENQAGNTATIFDNTGKTLIQTAIISDKQQIDLKLLSKGFYIVSVSNKTESLYAKIIKE
ncbi:MAG: T9SS type A sorting domain-containing protein [Prevotellaceae bacterium]|nr:T9SS type A sorting domain-containing protein [Prevotellaceae bacterium]